MANFYSINSLNDPSPPAAPGLVVEEDFSGQALRLSWRGAPPLAWARRLAGFLLVVATAVWLYGVFMVTLPLWELPEQKDDYVIAFFVIGGGVYFLYTLCSLVGKSLVYWEAFHWDTVEGVFRAQQHGWLWWGNKLETAPLTEIESILLELGAENGTTLPIKLRQVYSDDSEFGFSTTIDLTNLQLQRRTEAIELLFNLARMLDAKGYLCTANTFKEQKLVIWKNYPKAGADFAEEDLNEDSEQNFEESDELENYGSDADDADPSRILPLPRRGEMPDDLLPPPQRPITKTRRQLPPFDLTAFREKISTWKIETWDPGTTVQITKEAEPLGLAIVIGLFGLTVGGLLGWFPAWGIANIFLPLQESDRYLLTGVVGAAGGLALTFAAWNHSRAQDLLLDWRRGLITWKNGRRVQQWPLSDIRGLSLVTVRRSIESKTGPDELRYSNHLKLFVDQTAVTVVKDDVEQASALESGRILAPLANDLAAALDVECDSSVESDVPPPFRQTFRLTGGQWATLAALGLVLIGWLGTLGVLEARAQLAAREVRGLGVKIYRMGSYKREGELIGARYWNIEADGKDCSALRKDPERLRTLVTQLGNVGLDLEGANCTDQDLAIFRGLPAIRIARISETRVTNAGVIALAECENLHYLDATACRIGDPAAKALGNLKKLRFLYVAATMITRDGLRSIANIRSLEFIGISGQQTTPQRLREQLNVTP